MSDPKFVDLACELRHETAKAFLIFDGDKEVWIPRSLAEYDAQSQTLTIPEWLAQREGLI